MPPPPPKAKAALHAMTNMGFSSDVVMPVLRKLLDVYDKNWVYIEDNNYEVLIESILEEQESQASGVEPDRSLKRLRKMIDNPSPTMVVYDGLGEPSLKKPVLEAGVSSKVLRREMTEPVLPWVDNNIKTRASSSSCGSSVSQESAEHSFLLTHTVEKWPIVEGTHNFCIKEPKIEPDIEVPKTTKDAADMRKFLTPVPMVLPPNRPILGESEAHRRSECSQGKYLPGDISSPQAKAAEQLRHSAYKWKGKRSITLQNGKESELDVSPEASFTVDMTSSDTGEVKLVLGFNSRRPDIRMVGLDDFLRKFEERCLHSYKILQPGSIKKIMKEMCEFASVWTSEKASDEMHENIVRLPSAVVSMESPDGESALDGDGSMKDDCATPEVHGLKENGTSEKRKDVGAPDDSKSLVVVQLPEVALWEFIVPHDPNDISKGEERVRISVANEFSNEKYPSFFYYTPQNLFYKNAYVNFSLARIGDGNCCSDCFGDCIAAAIPCACARETEGEFAYTSNGLVKEAFLEECISMNCEPQKHHHIYCQDCPLERSKKRSRKCKGHLVQKFIKECWYKCGCHMQCKNRIVQRGITCNLQVFLTPEGKGWGLRTLDELPRGAFVCEYVGEVLTNMELYNRTIQKTRNAKHTYHVLLDADWGSEGVLKDEEALCLDATFYGNVARFVNHRCVDANLVEIPVEVETADHHYYHLAFFTTRRIEPYEELTWDYGIDFDGVGHPVKAFRCRCGSSFCRDVRVSRSRSKALILM